MKDNAFYSFILLAYNKDGEFSNRVGSNTFASGAYAFTGSIEALNSYTGNYISDFRVQVKTNPPAQAPPPSLQSSSVTNNSIGVSWSVSGNYSRD